MLKQLHPWHAIRTRYNKEFEVDDALVALNIPSYCPRYWLTFTSRNRSRTILIPYLSCWVFARWPADDPHVWHQIHNLRGVLAFIGADNPSPIPDSEFAALRLKIGEDNRLVEAEPALTPLIPGQVIRFIDGPYKSCLGVITYLYKNQRVARVEISALRGRKIPLTCSASWCEPAGEIPAGSPGSGRSRRRMRAGQHAPFRLSEVSVT